MTPGEEEKIDYKEFASDLAEYVKRQDDESWKHLVENYPFEAKGDDGRYVFLPGGHERVDNRQPKNFLVDMPERNQTLERTQDNGIYQDIAEYLSIDNAVDKLVKLAEMQEEYENTQVDQGTIRFGPTEESGLEVGVPSLGELAEAYNNEDTSETPYSDIDRDMLGSLASETSITLGTIDSTIHKQGSEVYVEKDTEEGTKFFKVDHVGEAISLDEAIGVYRAIRDGLSEDSGKELFENITEFFQVWEDEENRVLLDPVNDQVAVYDTSTIDLMQLDRDEANEHLRRFVDEDVVDKIEDFYDGIK